MSADTDKLIAQAANEPRYADPYTRVGWWMDHAAALAAALEAAERECEQFRIEADCALRDCDGMDLDRSLAVERAVAAEAQRDTLARAAKDAELALAALISSPILAQALAGIRAALAEVTPPEAQEA